MGHALLKVVLYLLVLGIGWYAETPVDPGARQREVDARWKDVRKPVQQECTLVRDHSCCSDQSHATARCSFSLAGK